LKFPCYYVICYIPSKIHKELEDYSVNIFPINPVHNTHKFWYISSPVLQQPQTFQLLKKYCILNIKRFSGIMFLGICLTANFIFLDF